MKTSIEKVKRAISRFPAVTFCACGYPLLSADEDEPIDAGWVKFRIEATAAGWLTLEFLAWLTTDMTNAGERVRFFPTAPPPYLNTPGKCLSFVIECYPLNGDQDKRFNRVAEFIDSCRKEYWKECYD